MIIPSFIIVYGWLLIVLCGLNIVVYMAMIDSEKSQEYTGRGAIVNFLINAIYILYIAITLKIL